MTEREWREELAKSLTGTDWAVDWSAAVQSFPHCLADTHHRITKKPKYVRVLRDVFRSPEARRAEIMRQLQTDGS